MAAAYHVFTDLPETDRAVVAARAVAHDLFLRWSILSVQIAKSHYDEAVRFYFSFRAPDQLQYECCHVMATEAIYDDVVSLNLVVRIMIESLEELFAEHDIVVFTPDFYTGEWTAMNL